MSRADEVDFRCVAIAYALETLNKMSVEELAALSKGLRILRDEPLHLWCGICTNIHRIILINALVDAHFDIDMGCFVVLVMPETWDCEVPLNGPCYEGQPYYDEVANKWDGEQGELRRTAIDRLIHRIDNIEIPARTMVECDWEDWRDE